MPATLDKQALAESYGWMYSLLKSDKSLWHVFSKAVSQGWDGPTFQAQIRRTSWWRKHSDSWKKWKALVVTNPAEAAARNRRLIAQLQDQAAAMGARPSYRQLNIMSHHALAFGWNDAQLKNALSHFVKTYHGFYSGEAAKNAQDLRTLGAKLGYNWTGKSLENAVTLMAGGNSTMDTQEAKLRKWAAGAFPVYAKQIMEGEDPLDIASPYIDSASRLLELPQGHFDLNSPTIRNAMQYKNAEGKPAMQGLAEFEEGVRSNPLWRGTKNSQDSMAATANTLLTKWKLIA
jgi:hypothetical protein